MSKFFFIEAEHLPKLEKLLQRQRDDEYIVLHESNGFADIAQYSQKYQNIHIVTVKADHLNWAYRLA